MDDTSLKIVDALAKKVLVLCSPKEYALEKKSSKKRKKSVYSSTEIQPGAAPRLQPPAPKSLPTPADTKLPTSDNRAGALLENYVRLGLGIQLQPSNTYNISFCTIS